jgi:ATP-binding cassette, subfamily B, bacterial PglK
MKQYLCEMLFLIGKDKNKIPLMVTYFLANSMLDLVGLGLIGPYIALVIDPELFSEGLLIDVIESIGLGSEQFSLLTLIGYILVGVFLLKAVFAIFINRTILVFSSKQQVRIRSVLMNAYQHMPYKDYLKRNSAEYIHAIQAYTGNFGSVLQTGLKMISDGLVALVILIMLAWTNGPALFLLVILLGGVVIVYDLIFKNKIRNYGVKVNKSSTKLLQGVQEGIEGLKEIRILGREQYFYQIVSTNSQDVANYSVKNQIISSIPRHILEFMLIIFVVSMVISTILLGQDLQALIPTLGVFGIAGLRLLPIANAASNNLMILRFDRNSISKLYSDLQILTNTDLTTETPIFPKTDTIFRDFKICNICFSYPNTKIPALNDLSLKIKSGESIGLIGSSGSGKTTLVDVMLGLLEPQKGELLYNGKKLKTEVNEWRLQVAYLPQQVFLIDNTLRNNIILGNDKETDDSRLEEALRKARLLDLVKQLPEGFDTLLGERGVRLSGGQRQRVSLARAFYFNRNILIMDEATSALDNETEMEIVDEIKYFKGKITMIVIAHRLTTVKYCDRIYRLADGNIIESGTFDQVVTKNDLKANQ